MSEKRENIYEDPSVKEFYGKKRFDQRFSKLSNEQLPRERSEKIEEGVKVYEGHTQKDFAEHLEAIHSKEARETFERVCQICEAVKEAGGRALIVGGAVRDEVLGMVSKDFDVEVYGLEPVVLERIVEKFGKIKEVGRAFGILKIAVFGGLEIDVSLPRIDSKVSEGHKGFDVKVDPNMSIAEAAKRRDFTFNAISKDPLTGEIFDPYGGVEDLRNRILRITDPDLFKDDPLRLLRAAQFVGRFGLAVEPESMEIMRGMVPELSELALDRVREEWEKLLMKSLKPSMGLNLLHSLGVLDRYYPELAELKGAKQELEWHPEGDVWVHTLMVVDAAKNIVEVEKLTGDTARVIMLASLCHDIAKPSTTELVEGRYRSPMHDVKGEEIAQTFLEKIGTRVKDIEKVVRLVKNHMLPGSLYIAEQKGETATDGAFRRAATRLHPATLEELTYVAEADRNGMGPYLDLNNPYQLLMPDGFPAGIWMRKRAKEIGIYKEKPKTLIMGRDLISLGYTPGKTFTEIINLAEDWRNQFGRSREDILEVLVSCKGNSSDAISELNKQLENS